MAHAVTWDQFIKNKSKLAEGLLLPNRRDENWKYSSLLQLKDFDFKAITTKNNQDGEIEFSFLNQKGESCGLSIQDLAKHGIIFEVINKDISPSSEFQDWFISFNDQKALTEKKYFTKDFFELQNESLWQRAYFLKIKTNHSLSGPLVIRWKLSNGLNTPRVWINIENNTRIDLIQVVDSSAKSAQATTALDLPLIEVELGKQTEVNSVFCSLGKKERTQISKIRWFMLEESKLKNISVSSSAQLIRENLNIHFLGARARAELFALGNVSEQETVDHQTCIDHLVGECESLQYYKNILDQKSRAVFNGRIIIRHNSQKANSEQLNSNLLLSSEAEVDSKPQLEIEADDVKATHGATVGQLNEDEIFYLQSRGLTADFAQSLLRSGFSQEIFDKIENPISKNFICKIFQETETKR